MSSTNENENESVTPLADSWTLHYDGGAKKKRVEWGSNIDKVLDFNTVEDFWRLQNNISVPTHLPNRSTYHLFKQGIEPKWEDEQNVRGGHWVVGFLSQHPNVVNQAWLYLCLGLIGNQFEDVKIICGAQMKAQSKNNRIQLWTNTARDEEGINRIGRKLIEILGTNVNLAFKPHHGDDSDVSYTMTSTSS